MTWQPLYDNWIYLLLGTAIVVVILLARRMAVAPKQRSWLLLGVRLMILALMALLLLNPVDRRETPLPPRPASVALLVDCSRSMVLGEPQTRFDQVQQTIDQATRMVRGETAPNISLYRFGEYVAQAPGLADLKAIDDTSQLVHALERLPSRMAGDMPRALVVFSDGAVDSPERLSELVAGYAEMGVEVHAWSPRDNSSRGDVSITELAVPKRVTTGDSATLRATVSSSGFAGERVVLSVRSVDRPKAPVLATLPMTLSDGEQSCELVVKVDRDIGDLMLEVPNLVGEAVSENNRVPFRLIERSRKLKVLYMEGSGGGEYRWLQNALQEDSDIECVSMIVNSQYASRPRLQRVGDPYRGYPTTRAELFEYDVVICSDISQAAYTPDQIKWTVELVAERGGGFAMIGGHTAFGSGGWDRTEWEKLIPFDIASRRDYMDVNFKVHVPPEVEQHPIWQIVEDPRENRRVLDAMPAFAGTNLISRIKPAATLLGESGAPLPRVGVMPIFASESFGRGRTFAMSTDTTYAWGTDFEREWGKGDNQYYRKFWRNVVRWLAENANSSRLLVNTDKVIYAPGDPVQISAEAFDSNLDPTTDYRITAHLLPTDSNLPEDPLQTNVMELNAIPSQQLYSGKLLARLPTELNDPSRAMHPVKILVTAFNGDQEVAHSELGIQLLNNSPEWKKPKLQPDNLQAIADAGGGDLLESSSDLTDLLRQFEPTPGEVLVHTLPRWDRRWYWIFLMGLLAIEWSLRRLTHNPTG